jgi:hypothetical protein
MRWFVARRFVGHHEPPPAAGRVLEVSGPHLEYEGTHHQVHFVIEADTSDEAVGVARAHFLSNVGEIVLVQQDG